MANFRRDAGRRKFSVRTFTIMATQYEIELEAFDDGSIKMVASEHESTFPHLATDRHFLAYYSQYF
jgi:hypothetical protein